MNRGKLTQVVDNLVLNSAYWLADARNRGELEVPFVRIGSRRPFITIEDNGPGVDPSVEGMLFQPFVSTKPKKVGRGLGLYITQQLLDSVGCEVSLLPERNPNGRKYIFQLDLTGVLDAS
jgi:C4-dicarboxylate-specific signal transduction histidine kinase